MEISSAAIAQSGMAEEDLRDLREKLEGCAEPIRSRLYIRVGEGLFPLSAVWEALDKENTVEEVDSVSSLNSPAHHGNLLEEPEQDNSLVVEPDYVMQEERWVEQEGEGEPRVMLQYNQGSQRRQCTVCGDRPESLKKHVHQEHLPFWFQLENACIPCGRSFENSQQRIEHQQDIHGEELPLRTTEYFRWLDSADLLLVRIVKAVGKDLLREMLEEFVSREWLPNTGEQWSPTMEAMLRDLSWVVAIPPARGMSVYQKMDPCKPRHPVEVLYWVSLMHAFSTMKLEDLELIHQHPLLDNGYAPDNLNVPLAIKFPRAVDSHCHLSACVEARKDVSNYLERSFEDLRDHHEHDTPLLVGVVNNRVFPRELNHGSAGSYQMIMEEEPDRPVNTVKIVDSVGIHPGVDVGERVWGEMEGLAHLETVRAVGECGLDYSQRYHPKQRHNFRRQVRLARRLKKPIILHLRPGRAGMSFVVEEALRILRQEEVRRNHPIHLHSFVGSHCDYKQWIRCFPNTIFGVSRKSVQLASPSFARLADLRKVVLETDTPHMKSPEITNHPCQLIQQAEWLASPRGVPVRAVFGATSHVATRFYKIMN